MGVSAPGLAQGALPLVLGTTRLGGALPVVTKSTSAERESGGASSPWVLKPPSRTFWPPSTLSTVAANHLGPLLGVSRRTTMTSSTPSVPPRRTAWLSVRSSDLSGEARQGKGLAVTEPS